MPTALHRNCVVCLASEDGIRADSQTLTILSMLVSDDVPLVKMVLDLCEPHQRRVRSAVAAVREQES